MNDLIINQFYEYLEKFLMELSKSSKKLKKVIEDKYKNINDPKYIDLIKTNIYTHKTQFLGKEEELDSFFENNSIELLEDINISSIWSKSDKDNKNAIVQYLKVFVFMFETTKNTDLKGGNSSDNEETMSNEENDSDEDNDEIFEEMLKKSLLDDKDNMKSFYESIEDKDNSIVGLAQNIANELKNDSDGGLENMMNMFKGGDGLNNLVNKITNKLDSKMKSGELNQQQLLNDAQKMMSANGNLFGNMFNNLNKAQQSNANNTNNANNTSDLNTNTCVEEIKDDVQKKTKKTKTKTKKPKK